VDEDVGRSVDALWRQTVAECPSLTYHQVMDDGPVWRARSQPDVTVQLIQRLFDELLFYLSDQVHCCVMFTTILSLCFCNVLLTTKPIHPIGT